MNRLDHIVVAATTLEQGAEYLRGLLGIEVPVGGVHATMGTHNRLMQLGDDSYLELIAIDPAGTVPARPRWFGLDTALLRAAIAQRPRLITWVMNTPDLAAVAAAGDFAIGTPTALSRDGLSWEIALTDDGRLLADGLLPYCIQWHSSPHPSRAMADLGCRLKKLTLHHSRPDWLAARLATLGATDLVEIDEIPDSESPYLSAELETPNGLVRLT
ncbi:MAG TPA: VOC family protein, partial [Gammaproteobacteria bacterium]|jgi:hypothetical protein